MMAEENPNQDKINALTALQGMVGWKIVVKVLEVNIQQIEAKLHGETKMDEGETIELLQRQRQDRIKLKTIPQDLIEEYKDKPEFPPELDPYE